MTRTPSMKVEKWITVDELKKTNKKKGKDVKVLNRLHFMNYLCSGLSIPEASEKLGITKFMDITSQKDGMKTVMLV